jgi:hypothetical protein
MLVETSAAHLGEHGGQPRAEGGNIGIEGRRGASLDAAAGISVEPTLGQASALTLPLQKPATLSGGSILANWPHLTYYGNMYGRVLAVRIVHRTIKALLKCP